ncbi:MBL fold metallo-hydrolase (plasmid) [Fusobacteria bacterium ZRK30]|nr:MBL fold metallo-hydrolase [Fusobacteria bacterium ZRK30]UUV20079.1 MBL fold metallo-hydrolase [Fusobacteria bacterium ZRK30]
MNNKISKYKEPIEIAKGIYWVGFYDDEYFLHCNPFLIIEGDEAVLIDGGSRNDFSTVMLKILQTGVNPNNIQKLIYHHYDPDLCGSIPDFEELIDNDDLSILSHEDNNVFIKYYGTNLKSECIEKNQFEFQFATGRKLKFIMTPYCHSSASFVTFDEETGTLFSSDLFGSTAKEWDLFSNLDSTCHTCSDYSLSGPFNCKLGKKECPISKILFFHQKIMTSKKSLDFALDKIKKLPIKTIASQHGSLIRGSKDINFIMDILKKEKKIGIDQFLEDDQI